MGTNFHAKTVFLDVSGQEITIYIHDLPGLSQSTPIEKIKMFCLNLRFSGAGLNIGHSSCLQLHPIAFSLHMLGYEVVGWLEK